MKYIAVIGLIMVAMFSCNKDDDDFTNCYAGPCTGDVKGQLLDYNGLDGCGWVIKLDEGGILEPTNLDDFVTDLVDGEIVYVDYVISAQLASICMVGEVVDLRCVSRR